MVLGTPGGRGSGGVFIGEGRDVGSLSKRYKVIDLLLSQTMSQQFRLQSRYVLLTYSQCGDLDPQLVCDHLATIPAECLIGRENHADGGIHLHAFVDFGRRVNIRDQRLFDVDGRHPNIQPCGRTPQKMLDYAIKDGDVVAGGLDPDLGGEDVSGDGTVWHTIANAETVDRFWELVRELAPRALLCNHQSLRAYADWHYRPPAVAYRHPCELRIVSDHVPELDYWVRDNLSGVGKSYTYGPARAASRCAGAQAATCSDGPLVRWFTSYTWPPAVKR